MINLKERREQLGLSQEDIATKINVTRGTVSKWEKGDIANMKRDKIASLSKVLKINPLLLLGLDPGSEPLKTSYNFYDTTIAAGMLTEVNPFTRNDVKKISLSDDVMGKYAGDKDIFISRINGESMNRIIPDNSLIAVKSYDSLAGLYEGDIVVFQDGGDMSVKRYYNSPKSKTVTFSPYSTDECFSPITYRYEDLDDIKILGKVVVYIVNLK